MTVAELIQHFDRYLAKYPGKTLVIRADIDDKQHQVILRAAPEIVFDAVGLGNSFSVFSAKAVLQGLNPNAPVSVMRGITKYDIVDTADRQSAVILLTKQSV